MVCSYKKIKVSSSYHTELLLERENFKFLLSIQSFSWFSLFCGISFLIKLIHYAENLFRFVLFNRKKNNLNFFLKIMKNL